MARTFTHQKRLFLLNKIDEVIKLWATGSGHGSFNFTVRDGIPSLQCDLKLSIEDIGDETHPVHHHQQQHDAHARRPRHRGPARQARDRIRAVKHQSALAEAATAPVVKLPDTDVAADTADVIVSTSTLSSVLSLPHTTASTAPVASSQTTTTNTTSSSFSMPLASTRQLPSAMVCDVTDKLCPNSQYLADSIPQLDGSLQSNLSNQWLYKCCRNETFFFT